MIPPTSIDGTDITGATIDGTDVEEITVDGDVVFTSAPPAIPSGAVAHYQFEDNTNTSTATDSVGSNDGTITGATYETGKVGSFALEFTGGSQYVDLGDTNFFENTDFTAAFWLNLNTIPTNANKYYTLAPGYDDITHPPHIFYDNNNLTNSDGIAIRSFDGNNVDFINSNVSHSVGSWVHVAISLDNSNGSVNIWIDNSKEVNGATLNNLTTNNQDYYIGAYNSGNGTDEEGLGGLMDDVVVYDRILTDTEIDRLYQRGQ